MHEIENAGIAGPLTILLVGNSQTVEGASEGAILNQELLCHSLQWVGGVCPFKSFYSFVSSPTSHSS